MEVVNTRGDGAADRHLADKTIEEDPAGGNLIADAGSASMLEQ